MPTLIMGRWPVKLDGSVRGKAMAFLQKLSTDDTTPGLHVEPIKNSIDPRVRTGRVDQFWRAVMFRLDGGGNTHYFVHGVWPHDDAIEVARTASLTVNPVNGLPDVTNGPMFPTDPGLGSPPGAADGDGGPTTSDGVDDQGTGGDEELPASPTPLLFRLGCERADLVDRLGVPEDVADEAMSAPDEDALATLAERHEGWLGLILIDLATGEPVEAIVEKLHLRKPTGSTDSDTDIIESFQQPAAQTQYTFIDDQDELRRVIESGDFGAWRVFLHPEQRKYVERTFSGPFRLSGGAGTGKTVVVVHRARELSRRDPDSRIVITTFTTNLADSLRDSLIQLDPTVPRAKALGQPGVLVTGIDALASTVLRTSGSGLAGAVESVLGEPRSEISGRVPNDRWRTVVETAGSSLPPTLANETFLSSEYNLVVLPNRIRSEGDYLRVRRPGRGVALDRAKRSAVWSLFAAYRAQNRVEGSLDFAEAAAVAAEALAASPSGPPADHVLVDEGQDLSPTHWQLLRSSVDQGPNDLFIAEDSHQRIYGPRTVLGHYGIKIVGRSQRLTLNYRTTAQNLGYAMTILEGGDYVDIENESESTGYRSARSGPTPTIQAVPSLAAELNAVVSHVRGWLESDSSPETIAVLVQDQYQRDRVTNTLNDQGVPARAVDRERPGTGRVLVMTMHRAKGMEFSKILIADVGHRSAAEKARLDAMEPSERTDAELRTRSLVYVAATRARDELVVLQRP